jgi:hypothetical protein
MMKRGSTSSAVSSDSNTRRNSDGTESTTKKVIGASSRLYPGPGRKQPTAAMLEQQRKDREHHERFANLTKFPEVPNNKVALQPTVATLMMPVSLMAQRSMATRTAAQRSAARNLFDSRRDQMMTVQDMRQNMQNGIGHHGRESNIQRFMHAGGTTRTHSSQRHGYGQQQHHHHQQQGYGSFEQAYQHPHQQPQLQTTQQYQYKAAHLRQHSVQSHNTYQSKNVQQQQSASSQYYESQQQTQPQSTFAQQYYMRSQFYYQNRNNQNNKHPKHVWKPH